MSKDYDDGYDAGYDAGSEGAWNNGYEEAKGEIGFDTVSEDLKNRNLCFSCDCRKYGFDCMQDFPVEYMERKIHGDQEEDPKPTKRKKVYTDHDRAMEIFHPK